MFRNAEIHDSIVELHMQWAGDVSNAKLLDVGLGEGNPLSLKLAREAREYVAIDLKSATEMNAIRSCLRVSFMLRKQ